MFTMKLWCYYTSTFVCLLIGSVRSQAIPCTTPNGEGAICKSLFSCPVLKNAVAISDASVEKFIEASTVACGQGTLLVCCGSYANYTRLNTATVAVKHSETLPTTPEAKREYALQKLIPSKKYCGMQHSDDYFHDYNTSETTVDELPWIMFVSCENSDGPMASSINSERNYAITSRDCDCSGVLISNRYVLTSTNCASAKWVGLGQREQYKNISCTPTAYGDDDCSEAAKTPFTEQIRHPDNTLLLLRLKNKIDYSDYIRPICLPLEEADRIDIGDTVTSSKWEVSDKVRGFVREKLNQTVTTIDKCSRNFEELHLEKSSKYMCTELEDLVTVLCKTDSGSPMMYKRDNNWFVGGILYAGYCLDKTAVGNRLTPEVVNWILENMKP